MEIKIVCFEDEKDDGGVSTTYLFSGDKISHNKIEVTNLQINDWKDNANGNFIGIPNEYYTKSDLPNLSSLFISFYDKNGDYDFILVRNAVIYITSNGHTIDRINVE